MFYDRAGNRTRRIAKGVEERYQYDPRNRLTAYTKNGVTTPFQYDNAGNLLVDDKAQYSYDAFNRTTKVETFDGNIQLNRYDAEGLRYEMEENGNLVQFIFNQEREVVTEEDSTGITRLIHDRGLIARSTDAARTYYHYASDEMGSTTHIVDEVGAIQNWYEYDAWGNITAKQEAIPNRYTYYGQQLDTITQQYYLRARFYNPVIGRFTQEDTYRGDGLNLYAYCANNPILYLDPSGNEFVGYKECLGRTHQKQLLKYMDASNLSDTLKNDIKGKIEDAKNNKKKEIENPIHEVTEYYRDLIKGSAIDENGRITEINKEDLIILAILNSDNGIKFSTKNGNISPHILIGTVRNKEGEVIGAVDFYNSKAKGAKGRYEIRNNTQHGIYHTEAKMLQDLRDGKFGEVGEDSIVHMIGYNPCCNLCQRKIEFFIKGFWSPSSKEVEQLPSKQYQFTKFFYWDIKSNVIKKIGPHINTKYRSGCDT